MHRDLKPGNVMVDPIENVLRVIDWGIAGFYNPNVPSPVLMGTTPYMAPEILVGNKGYSYTVDIWSLGVMMASILFKCKGIFTSSAFEIEDQLDNIAMVMGTAPLYTYMSKFGT